jgi:hypothetical protein
MPPSSGWMNNSDDAANQVVQIAAANQRRNMAALSSQPTFVPLPLDPPQGLGMAGVTRTGVQGRATLNVAFADKEAVLTWLNMQSDDVNVVFAARAALRVLPTIAASSHVGGRKNRREIILRAFRAVAAAWAVASYPSHRNMLNRAAGA